MLRRRREVETSSTIEEAGLERFHEWVLSLPWVVERPYEPGTPGVRCFGVECEPLGRRRVWLLTGLAVDDADGGLAVVLPTDAATDIEALGWGQMVAVLFDEYVVVTLNRSTVNRRQKVEGLVLTAYGYAMS